MNNLYEALEICLQDIEQGADVETVLFRYPDLAEELRPILEASAGAKNMAVPAPSAEVVRRNRAKVLQHAAQMREASIKSSRRLWFASLRRVAVTLAVLTVLFVSGTGLVGASSNTLPGDNLYPVKRTWEGLRVFFTLNGQEREALELENENERLQELNELLQAGRSEEVDFNGLVTSQNGKEWTVAGVRILISSQTDIREQGIAVGSPVRVRGITQENGTVLAERIQLLSSKAILPEVEAEHESDVDQNNSGPGSATEQPSIEETETPELENENSGSNSGSNENSNENENSNSNENSGSGNETNEANENGSNDNENVSNENSNENGGQESNNNQNENENENNSGGEENNNSGGGESGGED